jgi:hypothetical protein
MNPNSLVVKGVNRVTYFTSQAQDAAAKIKAAQAEVARADRAYRRGGSVDDLNAANRRLAACHNALYEADGGVVPDTRGN